MADATPDNQATSISISNLILPQSLHIPSPFVPPSSTLDSTSSPPTTEQPATLSVTLEFRAPFASAASSDQLDSSTIHYGHLSKRVRASCAEDPVRTVDSVFDRALAVIKDMASTGGTFLLRRAVLTVRIAKGSLVAPDGAKVRRAIRFNVPGDDDVRWGLAVQDARVQVLVGVNAKERWAKQPIVASFDVEGGGRQKLVDAVWRIEGRLVQILEETTFETLETLVEHTFQRLRAEILDRNLSGTTFRLRLEKPQAIAFADAPAVEIVRTVSNK